MQRLLLCCAASLLAAAPTAVYGQTIDGVRLVGGSYNYGILEARVNGVWGRVCNARSGSNPGFDNNAASAVCAMLGFRPVTGLAASLGSVLTGSPNTVLAVTSCAGFNPSAESTWNLRTCVLTAGSSIPTDCNRDRSLDAAVSCVFDTTTATTTRGPTTTANLATVAPIDCTNVTDVSLSPGPTEGLVLIRNPTTSAFGTICAAGFGVAEAEAICRMLCKGTVNAIGTSGKYVSEAAKHPVMLSGLSCPSNATSTNDCTHNGWGVASGVCTSSAAVTVRCSEIDLAPPSIPQATVQCFDYAAHVYFNASEVNSSSLISLVGSVDASVCNFTKGENSTTVWAQIPYIGCGSTLTSNDTHMMYTARLYKNVTKVGGAYVDAPYVYTVVCILSKPNAATARLGPAARTVPPISDGDTYTSDIKVYRLYSGKAFSNEVLPGQSLTVGSRVYARVSVTSPLAVRLVVRSCWATPTPTSTERYYVVRDKCEMNSAKLFIVDEKSIAINFIVMSFSDTMSTEVYISCDVQVCTVSDTSGKCAQVCGAPVRRRRSASEEEPQLGGRQPLDGPFRLTHVISTSGAGRLEPLASAAALIPMATLALVRHF